MENSFILGVRSYANKCCMQTNHTYDGKPYIFHKDMVFDFCKKYKHLIDPADFTIVGAACYTHDLIEDCRVNKHQIITEYGETIGALTVLLTKTCKESIRDYYKAISNNRLATYVKICDRLANTKYSYDTNNQHKLKKYKSLHKQFSDILYYPKFEPMFEELETYVK